MNNKEAITSFYGKALTVNSETRPTEILTPLLENGYQSFGSIDTKSAKQLVQQLEFFWKLIPNLTWEIQEIINEGDKYVVRSIATGSPNGDFMGVATDGSKSFKIMTTDIHTIKNGKFIDTFHLEDWPTAFKQLQ